MAHSIISGIYQVINLVNGKRYIGSSNSIKRRWYEHRKHLCEGLHPNPLLQNSWNKHGSSSFKMSLLEEVGDIQLLRAREIFWIEALRPEYNIAPVIEGNFRVRHSPEAREKIRQARLGKKHSEETRLQMSASAKKRGMSEQLKLKQRIAVTGRPRPKSVREAIARGKTGTPLTEEHRARVSEGLRKWWENRRTSI